MTTLAEALVAAHVPEQFHVELPKEELKVNQLFKGCFTKFEVPILIKVRCDKEDQGLQFIASYHLNSIEAATKQEAQEKINQKLSDIQYTMKGTDNGCPLYWKFYKTVNPR